MAIKINNITPEMSVWGMKLMGARSTPTNVPQYAYNYTIIINNNGKIIDKDGNIVDNTMLNLGRCGDIEVCKLVFDISRIENYNELETVDNTGEYNVYCVFKDTFNNKWTYEVELSRDTGTLILPEKITEKPGDYEMILVFQEAKSLDKTPNVPEAREYFVSDIFKGYVQESAWQFVGNTEEINDFKKGSDHLAIFKSPIKIESEGNMADNNPHITTLSDSLGNQGDRYVKQINWEKTDRYNLNKFIAYFFNEQYLKKCYAYQVYDTNVVWVPEEVTDLRNENITNWKMLLTLTNDNKTQRLVYNTLEFTITDNWLRADDLYVDINKNYVLLRDSEGNLLLDSEGVILTAPVEELTWQI